MDAGPKIISLFSSATELLYEFGLQESIAGVSHDCDWPPAAKEKPRVSYTNVWDQLSAVRSGRVHAVDGNAYFNRSGPRIVDSLEILAHLVHPERIGPPLTPESRARALCQLT